MRVNWMDGIGSEKLDRGKNGLGEGIAARGGRGNEFLVDKIHDFTQLSMKHKKEMGKIPP